MFDLQELMAYLEEMKNRRMKVPMSSGGVPLSYGNGFDPESAQYDMTSALRAGLQPDNTGHWPSRVPQSGMLLKGRSHPTYWMTEEGEKQAGYDIFNKDGRFYSQRPGFVGGNVPGVDGRRPSRMEIRMPINTLTHTSTRG